MELRLLTSEMFSFRLAEENLFDPDWFIPHLDDIIRYHPDGCFALLHNHHPVGMITSTPYRNVGWLGWLYVSKDHRLCGLGERLMQAGIDHLNGLGIGTIIIEAVVEAVSLYRRIGFREQFHTGHYQLDPDKFTSHPHEQIAVHRMTDERLRELAAFDRRFFHEDRLRFFEIVAENKNFEGYLAETDGRICGFLFLTQTSRNRQVSPMVVDPQENRGTAIASALFRAAFDVSDKPLYFRCPMVDMERSRILVQLGATAVDYHTVRMVLGSEYPLERVGVLSLGCPGKG